MRSVLFFPGYYQHSTDLPLPVTTVAIHSFRRILIFRFSNARPIHFLVITE